MTSSQGKLGGLFAQSKARRYLFAFLVIILGAVVGGSPLPRTSSADSGVGTQPVPPSSRTQTGGGPQPFMGPHPPNRIPPPENPVPKHRARPPAEKRSVIASFPVPNQLPRGIQKPRLVSGDDYLSGGPEKFNQPRPKDVGHHTSEKRSQVVAEPYFEERSSSNASANDGIPAKDFKFFVFGQF
ncbi:uncharacterized protein MEPE_06343 [Melanopsichium pennsylvanicum]|uniref:Uncharacterized protein n=2 Tax=Melanopsichium pennsylvanicum TaxID=63383 RepID=A0AAJ4XSP0_9BASI|nr:uncharacterized protein BN887_06330 [Melanopsichium pennsylvanicum 4]SNX87633.1 uncharacterized protein MEPE_06343 [Melanopsichium pennsylvanicum]